ncbi:MAG TPA: hypothetical protein VKB18_02235 [Gemmatimonadota bacterium]|nr:hypothetical protein [Gemmatimonadota bacterium]
MSTRRTAARPSETGLLRRRLGAGAVPCLAAAVVGLWLVGCPGDSGKGGPATSDTLSTRRRDSVIGASRIPGASGVRKAMELSDSARARAARLDTIGGR